MTGYFFQRGFMRVLPLIALLPLLPGPVQAGEAPPKPPVPVSAGGMNLAGELAVSGQFYLTFEIAAARISLCHSGIALRHYTFRELQIGYPRIFGFSRKPVKPFISTIWKEGTLSPPLVLNRIKIIPGNESTRPTPNAPGVLPPSMEELSPVPPSFAICFEGRQIVQIVLQGKVPGSTVMQPEWDARWNDFLEALGIRTADRVRLRVKMDAKDGAALYRVFPEKPGMVVLP